MRNFFTVFLAIILAVAVIGAVAVLFTPKEPDDNPSTDTDTNTSTGTGTDNGDLTPDIEPEEKPTIEVEDVEDLTSTLENIEDGAVIAIPASIEFSEPVSIGNKEVAFVFSEDFDKTVSLELEEGKLNRKITL